LLLRHGQWSHLVEVSVGRIENVAYPKLVQQVWITRFDVAEEEKVRFDFLDARTVAHHPVGIASILRSVSLARSIPNPGDSTPGIW